MDALRALLQMSGLQMSGLRMSGLKVSGLLVGLSCASTGFTAEVQPPPEDWYQIEIIVFAPMNPLRTAESWPSDPPTYPADMLFIAPTSDDARRPSTLTQLLQLQGEDPDSVQSGLDATPDTGFLFENRSRASRQAVIAATAPDAIDTTGDSKQEVPLEDFFNSATSRPFRELPATDRLMGDIAGSLRRSSSYRLLLHSGWVQPVRDRDLAYPVLIQAGDRSGDLFEIDGTIRIGRSRYLHADLDLGYTSFEPLDNEARPIPAIVASLDATTRRQFGELVDAETARLRVTPAESHLLRDSRRMRSGTAHYIDHPDFGVIIKTERFEPARPSVEG